jgi:predicted ATPase/class 3 adenylate cyclase/GAF domain-containing protein
MDKVTHGYEVHETLYESARTVVYRAVRKPDSLPVVIKTLRADAPRAGDVASLRREYRVTRRLRAPGVVRVYDLEPWLNGLAMIAEDIGASSLDQQLESFKDERLEWFFKVALPVARALVQVHDQVVHGDISPANILCNPATLDIRLTDFGLASEINREHGALTAEPLSDPSLPYMSPERSGRMNRELDHRSDLYSLGAVFYELLTGSRALVAQNRPDWIYNHVTRRPRPPKDVDPAVPEMLSLIVLRLLEKNPEERYQSARGLLHDLEECHTRWQSSGRVDSFSIGREDTQPALAGLQRLCGRDQEVSQLLRQFERAAQGGSVGVLVSGDAGVGKSALISAIRRPILRLNGYFIEGKFDQFQRPQPYAAFAQALRQLVVQVLNEPEELISRRVAELRDVLGPNGQLVVNLVPEFERLIGPQSQLARGNPVEEQNRFQTTIGALVRTFAGKNHPLVLFLDDLHWSDEETLALIETLLRDPSLRSFFFVGSFRESDLRARHPLLASISRLQRDARTELIRLGPLDEQAVRQVVRAALHADAERSAPLVSHLMERTRGNALFLSEALRAVHRAGALTFDTQTNVWTWDMKRVRDILNRDDVVELLALRLRALSDTTRSQLSLASCIGPRFDLDTLAIVQGSTPAVAASSLADAAHEGAIIQTSEDGVPSSARPQDFDTPTQPVSFRFQHDYAQQAAHSFLTAQEKVDIHRRIGRALLERSALVQREERLIEIVHHLNEALDSIETDDERLELAMLNLAAARKAMRSAAYGPAFALLEIGASILPADSWSKHPEATRDLHQQFAACAYLSGHLQLAEQICRELLERAPNALAKAEVHAMQLVQLVFCDRMDEAVQAGLRGLSLLGMRMSKRPSAFAIAKDLLAAKSRTRGRSIESFAEAQRLTEPAVTLCLRILIDFLPPAYLTGNDRLFAAAVLGGANLSLKHGVGPESASAYASYVVLLAGLGELKSAYEFGQLSLRLTERFGTDSHCRNQTLYTVFGHSWNRPWQEMRSLFEAAVKAGLDSGDMLFTAYACGWIHLWDPQVDLLTAWNEGRKYLSIIQRSGYQNAYDAASLAQQLFKNLLGKTRSELTLSDDTFDEAECLERMQRQGNVSGLGIRTLYQIKLSLLYEDFERGFDFVENPGPGLRALAGSPYLVEYTIHAFLVCASIDGKRKSAARRHMRRLRRNMARWAKHCPGNFGQHLQLMDAEAAGLRGRVAEAAQLYSAAIAAAREGGFLRYQALANERAARFFVSSGLHDVAAVYIKEARRLYARWGASAKVRSLDERHRQLLDHAPRELPSTANAASDWSEVEALWKASQTLSEEVVLENMLERLMVILREHGGATRAVLILREPDSHQFLVQAETHENREVTVRQQQPLEHAAIPVNLVRSAISAAEPIVVSDISDRPELLYDPYLRRSDARSLLVMPILHGGSALGVLYLENHRTAHVFTPERLAAFRMLASQAAISLQNARLYDHLQQMADSFSRFVPRQFLRGLGRAQFIDMRVGESVQKTMTVLFSDMRGFTKLVEAMSPEENVKFVNSYISYMEPAILAHSGFVDSFIGDAIMALFDRAPEYAVRAALGMLEALEEFNMDRAAAGMPPVSIGIGINTGPLTMGTIGGTDRLKCGVLGDTVNVASRIEGLTKRYRLRLLISGQAWVAMPAAARAHTRFVDRVCVAGHTEATDLFDVFAADPEELRRAKEASGDRWRAALDLYYARRFHDAEQEFQALSQTLPGDPVTAMFAARAARLQATPPDNAWTGVEMLTEK